eukprot:gene38546-46853_t
MTDDAKYVYWQVTALLLQDDLPPAMLAVAEKMLRKVIFELSASSPLGAEELPLFLNVLLRAGKPAEALEALRSLHTRPRGAGIHDEDAFQQLPNRVGFSDMQRDLVEIDLLRLLLADSHSQAQEALARHCEAFLQQHADHWAAHRVLLDVVLRRALPPRSLGAWGAHTEALSELMALRDVAFALPLPATSGEAVDFSALAAYVSFLRGLQAACNHKSRGACLAELRALSVCLVHGDLLLAPSEPAELLLLLQGEASWLALLRRLLVRYVERFGAKTCCASDLLPVLQSLCVYVLEKGRGQGAAWLGELFAQLEGLRLQVLRDVHEHIGLEGMEGKGDKEGKGEGKGEREGARDESEGEDDEDEKKKKNKHKKKKPAAPAAPSTTTNSNNNNNNSGEPQLRPMDVEGNRRASEAHGALLALLTRHAGLDKLLHSLHPLVARAAPAEPYFNHARVQARMALFSRVFLFIQQTHPVQSQPPVDGSKEGREGNVCVWGEELLVCLSTHYRALCGCLCVGSHAPSSDARLLSGPGDLRAQTQLLLRWCVFLQWAVGVTKGVSVCLLRDLLEVAGLLQHTLLISTAFQTLGVKNIQFDSTAYLVLPFMLKYGMFQEARAIY